MKLQTDYRWLRRSGLAPWCAVRFLIQHRVKRAINRYG